MEPIFFSCLLLLAMIVVLAAGISHAHGRIYELAEKQIKDYDSLAGAITNTASYKTVQSDRTYYNARLNKIEREVFKVQLPAWKRFLVGIFDL